ncbi:SDR family NAD(P)-dependent oxidoreductase [uncultured Pseudokineococcus sp.]|uniref:SDR family NAD(P)-dependent oxidoreductase n=1 Tax=uncultured Pseudokineococcus sp. TaxID=1642928 RepID=UPI00260B8D4C|nr:SDR family NAD(P)-dependent oxidoreductase [uncultured Pseudokineococcus sp.]
MRLDGATALVTGAGSGLGAATAAELARGGARVVLLDLHADAAARSLGALPAGPAGAAAHVALAGDVTSEEDVAAAVGAAGSVPGSPLRAVVHCAGVGTPGKVLGRRGPLPLADFERVLRVNVAGTFNVLRLAAAAMAGSEPVGPDGEERGVVVLTASVAAFDGQVGQPAYAASKAAVAGLVLPAARELAASRIRVLAVAPGVFATPMVAGLPEEAVADLEAGVPHPGRLGRPEEFAALARHLLENPYLNGEVVRLDGALRMPPA